MYKRIFFCLTVFLISCFFIPSVIMAGPAKAGKFQHADRNNDGSVDKKELKMEKDFERDQKSKVNNWWEKKADTNSDGKVDGNESFSWKAQQKERMDLNSDGKIDPKEKGLSWRHGRSKVNKPAEAKFDADNDGWLAPEEARQMLSEKARLVRTKGKASVDTDLEAQYDTDSNGIISPEEAEVMKEDVK
jgi:Ca2+-binding EF-hand superfamily protein